LRPCTAKPLSLSYTSFFTESDSVSNSYQWRRPFPGHRPRRDYFQGSLLYSGDIWGTVIASSDSARKVRRFGFRYPIRFQQYFRYYYNTTHLRGYIKVVGSGVSAGNKIGWPDVNKCYRYQIRKDSTTGNYKKMLLFTLAASILNSKVCFFFPWAVTAYPRCSLVKHKTPNCMDTT